MTYLIGTKFPLNTININDKKVAKNSMPAAALISRSFKTGMLNPSTSSPNLISFLILYFIEMIRKGRKISSWVTILGIFPIIVSFIDKRIAEL